MSPWNLPFIRWADTVRVAAGGRGAFERQIYDHELIYVIEGRGSLILDGRRYQIGANDLFLVRPRQFHSFLADCGHAQRLLGVHFDWEWRPDTAQFRKFRAATAPHETDLWREPREIRGWDADAQPVLNLGSRPRVRRVLEEVVTEFGRGEPESPSIASALLAAGCGHIGREARLLSEQSAHPIGADAVRRVQRAREWLEGAATLSIEETAAKVGWSGDHLRRMMRAATGEAPAQIQTAARMRRARELLRYGALPVSEIARQCGFEDASHFARVFKREVGVTPREWAAMALRHPEMQHDKD